MAQINSDVSGVGGRVTHIEKKMGEFAGAHNELVDAHNDKEEEIDALKSQLADLEDHSRSVT